MMTQYILDERLKNSSFSICNLSLCELRLKNNTDYPWVILIPRVNKVITECYELNNEMQQLLTQEINRVALTMKKHFRADKINIGALGNIVSQLHIHVIARFKKDLLWPHSVWQEALRNKPYLPEQKTKLVAQLRALFQ